MNEQAAEVLKHLADKLDIPVQQLWAGLIAYAPFTFYQWLAGVLIGVFLSALCFGVLAWCIAKKPEEDGVIGLFMVTVAVMIITGLYGVGGMSNALAARYAPEAWAAKYIIQKAHD